MPPSRPVSARRSWLPLFGIALIVLVLALVFAWLAGWIGGRGLTAQQLTDTIEGGKPFAGYRRAHAKGVCVAGSFRPTAQAASLSSARVFTQPMTPVLGRLSIGGADPHGADAKARVRSMGMLLKTDDGQEWRTAMNSFPFFAVKTPEGFRAQTIASVPDPATGKPDPIKMQAFLAQYPEARKFLAWATSAPWSNSWANTQFNGVDSFYFTNTQGQRRAVRWAMRPQAPFEDLSAGQRKQSDKDFLAEEFAQRLKQGPVRWDLVVTEAGPGDAIDDPSQPWPADRTQVVAGTLQIDAMRPQEGGACNNLNFDPNILPSGMAPSADPILAARSSVYSVSFNRRERELAHAHAPAAAASTGGAR